MRISRILFCFTLAVSAALSAPLPGQGLGDDGRPSSRRSSSMRARSSANHSERAARAAWSPSRPSAKRTVDVTSPRDNPADHSRVAAKQGVTSPVRLVDHVEDIPAGSVLGSPVVPMPMDGQIVYESGGSACDLLPGGCGCGDSVCDGGCGFEAACGVEAACCDGGCDSLGCDGGCSMCGELCSPNAWRPCLTLCAPQDGWFSAEYLAWWQDGMDLPPLVTTSTDPTVAQTAAGVLGSPTTQTLFGGGDVLDDAFDGLRIRFGVWLNKTHTWGVGAEYFNIGQESESFNESSSGGTVLARPFQNVLNGGVEESQLIAFVDANTSLAGTVDVRATSELTGAGFHFRYLRDCDQGCGRGLFCGGADHYCSRSEMRFGYRHMDLDEGVSINEQFVSSADDPGSFNITDTFDTRNQFNGFDLGWMYRRTRGFWTFDSTIRLALGNNRQTVDINGETSIDGAAAVSGGILATRSNIGRHEQDEFAVIPEISVGLGYQLTDHLRATVGYNFIYWSNVVRPGDQISRIVNPELFVPEVDPLTGGLFPEFEFDTTDYWVQGISVGGEFRW